MITTKTRKARARPHAADHDPVWNPKPVEYERKAGSGSLDIVHNARGTVMHRARYWTNSPTGVRLRKAVYAKTEAQVLRKLEAILKTPTSKGHAKETIAKFLTETFLPGVKKKVRASTYESYRGVIDPRKKHEDKKREKIASIVDDIGSVRVGDFTIENGDAWITSMQERAKDARGKRTIQLAVRVLKQAYRVAYNDPKHGVNPIANLGLPKAPERRQHILDLNETRRLLTSALATEYGPLFYLAVATSARQGELFALRWENVDLDGAKAYVVETVSRGYEDEPHKAEDPKTKDSYRTLFLDGGSVRLLRDHLAQQTGPNPLGLVFPSASTTEGRGGSYLSKDNVTGRVLPRLLTTARIGKTRGAVTFHTLRHVGNSLLDAKRVPLSALQRRLGHKNRSVTARYTHSLDAEQIKAARLMGTLLAPVLDARKWVTSGVTTAKTAPKRRIRKTRESQ